MGIRLEYIFLMISPIIIHEDLWDKHKLQMNDFDEIK